MRRYLWSMLLLAGCFDPLPQAQCGSDSECPAGQMCRDLVCVPAEVDGRIDEGIDDMRLPDRAVDMAPASDMAVVPVDLGADMPADMAADMALVSDMALDMRADAADMSRDAQLDAGDGGCIERPEICNGADDDCDERIDEGAEAVCYTFSPETRDVGECRSGASACLAGGVVGECQGQIGPQPEQCNDLDDDCDGIIDNFRVDCFSGEDAQLGVGECRQGRSTCAAGQFGPCQGEVPPRVEQCDGARDEDCDGRSTKASTSSTIRSIVGSAALSAMKGRRAVRAAVAT